MKTSAAPARFPTREGVARQPPPLKPALPSNLKHGHCRRGQRSRTYYSWQAMLARCTNPRHPWYHRYGERGITVCKRWLTFKNFLADMGDRPGVEREFTLERKNNDKGYSKRNCKWASPLEQSLNRETPEEKAERLAYLEKVQREEQERGESAF